MKSDFEKKLHENLSQAAIKELLPGYDREDNWMRLSERLHHKKKPVALFWFTHAAAILAGILISWFILSAPGKKQEHAQTMAQAVPAETIKQVIVHDTVHRSVSPHLNNHIKTVYIAATTKRQPEHITDTAAVATIVSPYSSRPAKNDTMNNRQPALANHTYKPFAVNLLDINNEDKVVLQQEQPAMKTGEKILNYLAIHMYSQPVKPEKTYPY